MLCPIASNFLATGLSVWTFLYNSTMMTLAINFYPSRPIVLDGSRGRCYKEQRRKVESIGGTYRSSVSEECSTLCMSCQEIREDQ